MPTDIPDIPPAPVVLPRHPHRLLAGGLALLVCYFVVASMLHNFVDPNLDYKNPINLHPLGDIGYIHDRDFAKLHLLSTVWKLMLLFPATLCLTLYAAMRVGHGRAAALSAYLAAIRPSHAVPLACVAVLGFTLFASLYVFQGQPVYDDERAYTFQAWVFQSGKLWAKEPPAAECFVNPFIIIKDGKWFGKYTAGHPLLLAAGMAVGSAYFLPILMASLIPLLVFVIGREMYGERVGLLAAGLIAVSPAFLFPASTLMNHGTVLFFLLLFTLAYLRSVPGRLWIWPVIAGLALGCALNIRPQDAVGFGAAFAVWSLIQMLHERRVAVIARQCLMLAAFAIPFALFLYYNKAITGEWFTLPFQYAKPEWHYGPEASAAAGIGLLKWMKSLTNLLINIWRMNQWLFGWSCSLLFVLLYFLRGTSDAKDRIFLGVILGQIIVYGFGIAGLLELGPRYYYPLLVPLVFFTAREMIALHTALARVTAGARLRGEMLVPAFVAISLLLAIGTFHAEKAVHFLNLTSRVAEPYRAVEQAGIHNAVVQIYSQPPAGWVFGHRSAKPDFSDDILYVHPNASKPMLELMAAFPERQLFRLSYDRERERTTLQAMTRPQLEQRVVREEARHHDGNRMEP